MENLGSFGIEMMRTDGSVRAWGKWRDTQNWLCLEHHCLDVAMTFMALAELTAFRRQLGSAMESQVTKAQVSRLAVVSFLHDLGKCNRGFQAKANPKIKDTAGHVLEAVALLLELSDVWPREWQKLIMDIVGWFDGGEEAAVAMLLAAISHHGRPVSLNDYQASGIGRYARKLWEKKDSYDPLQSLDDLARAARAAFSLAFEPNVPPIKATPSVQQRFAGIVMLADWIGSDTQFFPYRASPESDRLALARNAAHRAVHAIGLLPPDRRQIKTFAETFGFVPTALQKVMAQEITVDDTSRLLLAESETGSGKTEAALAWFFRLYAEGRVDGLYFALPTRVAARELYTRVLRAVDTAFEPSDRPGPVLLAVPSYVKANGQPVLPIPNGILWSDDARDQERENLWSAERPKRFLAAPVGVGTIDQALLSVLQVKHSLLRSVCLDRHLLVVDEVHASDPYMREVLKALLDGHLKRGGWALLLSATLGEVAAHAFFGHKILPLDQALQRPYPLLSTRRESHAMPAARARRIAVTLEPTLTNDHAIVPQLTQALQVGARVLVVCNTVARANALFRLIEHDLEQKHPDLLQALFALNGVRGPHHGRFAREDRECLDANVTAALGKNSTPGARLIIGTQTLEQSLDIDADWLVTDLAPMDVFIQRLGRLHRHERLIRPIGYETPRVLVRVPDRDLASYLQKDGILRGPAGLGLVYPDGRVLAKTWTELAQRGVVDLPTQARALIESTTHPEALVTLPEAWRAHGQYVEGRELADIRVALRTVLDDKSFGELHYIDKDEKVVTRLGRLTYDLPLVVPCRSAFGVPIERVAIPTFWLPEDRVPESVSVLSTAEGFCFEAGNRAFRYTRFGLERDDA